MRNSSTLCCKLISLSLLQIHCYLHYFIRFIYYLHLLLYFHLHSSFISSLKKVNYIILEHSPPPPRSLQLLQVDLILLRQQPYSRRRKYLIFILQPMTFLWLPLQRGLGMRPLSLLMTVLMLGLSFIGFNFEEDIADHAGLILVVVQLLDDALLG